MTNTAVQLQLFEALAPSHAAPVFAHHNLLVSGAGEGLSKRTGALSIASLREEGHEALAVAALAVLTGSSQAVRPVRSLHELAESFDLANVSRNPARFDPADLATLTHRTLALMDYEDARDRLVAHEIVGVSRRAFLARGARQHSSIRRGAQMVARRRGRDCDAARRQGVADGGAGTAAAGALGRNNLERLDRRDQGQDREEGQGAFPPASSCPHRLRRPGRNSPRCCRSSAMRRRRRGSAGGELQIAPFTSRSSTSKISVAFGGMTPPAPRAP